MVSHFLLLRYESYDASTLDYPDALQSRYRWLAMARTHAKDQHLWAAYKIKTEEFGMSTAKPPPLPKCGDKFLSAKPPEEL